MSWVKKDSAKFFVHSFGNDKFFEVNGYFISYCWKGYHLNGPMAVVSSHAQKDIYCKFFFVWCTAVNPKLSLRLNIQTVWEYCCLFLINEAYNLFQTLGMTKNWRNLGKIKICFSFSQLTSMHDHFVYLQVFAEYITILRIKIWFKRLISFEIACFNINFKRNGLFLDYARKCDVLQSFKHLYTHAMCIGLVILDI